MLIAANTLSTINKKHSIMTENIAKMYQTMPLTYNWMHVGALPVLMWSIRKDFVIEVMLSHKIFVPLVLIMIMTMKNIWFLIYSHHY